MTFDRSTERVKRNVEKKATIIWRDVTIFQAGLLFSLATSSFFFSVPFRVFQPLDK